MATEDTALEEEQEALSDDLQAELEDDMFFGEEDQPSEELTESEDFLSQDEMMDTGVDELSEEDLAVDKDMEGLMEDVSESSSKETTGENSLELEDEGLEESLNEELSAEADLETEDLNKVEDELLPLEEELEGSSEDGKISNEEDNDSELEKNPPLSEGDLSETKAEESPPEVASKAIDEETIKEPKANELQENTELTPIEDEEISDEETKTAETEQESEAELTLDEGTEKKDSESVVESMIEVPTEPPVAVPLEADKTDLSENQMTNETVAEAPAAADMLLHFQHEVRVEVARTRLTGKEITQITSGSIIELDKAAGEPVELILDDRTIAQGEIVMINKDKLGVRIIGIVQN